MPANSKPVDVSSSAINAIKLRSCACEASDMTIRPARFVWNASAVHYRIRFNQSQRLYERKGGVSDDGEGQTLIDLHVYRSCSRCTDQ